MAHIRLAREWSQSQPCHVYISESVCCSAFCSLKHEWNAIGTSILLWRWCQPHACTFPLLPDSTLRPPVCPSWLSVLFASRHRPSHEVSCFANPYLTDSRRGAHLAWGISVRQSAARDAVGNSGICVSYCRYHAMITHPSPNDIFVLFSKSSSAYCATALWSISWIVMPLRYYSFLYKAVLSSLYINCVMSHMVQSSWLPLSSAITEPSRFHGQWAYSVMKMALAHFGTVCHSEIQCHLSHSLFLPLSFSLTVLS